MSQEFHVRSYEPGDEEDIVELLRQSFPDWARMETPVDYWRWKYLDCPGDSIIYVAVSEGRIVGSNHMILVNVNVGDRVFKGRYSDDVATHPNNRRLGIYKGLIEATLKECTQRGTDVCYQVTVNQILINDNLMRDWNNFPHPISHMMRVNSVKEYFEAVSIENAAVKRYAFSALKAVESLSKRFHENPRIQSEFTLEEIQFFDDRINTFFNRIKEKYHFIVERYKEYLNWRYLDTRGGCQIVKQATDSEGVLGYSVLQVKGDGASREGYITDLLALDGRDDVVYRLLVDACEYFDGLNINSINYRVAKDHNHQDLASTLGFIDVRGNFPLMIDCRTIEAKNELKLLENSTPSKVHFTYGDYY